MKRKLRRFLPWVAAAVVVAMILLALRPTPQAADFAAVARGPLTVTVGEEGRTRVRERFTVSAPLAGRVLRIRLEPGDPVVAGETVLATFRPSDPNLLDSRSRAEAQGRASAARATLGEAEAQHRRAQAQLEFRRQEEARSSRLAKEGIVSQEALDAARLALATAERELEATRFAESSASYRLEVARATLVQGGRSAEGEAITLTSPIDGRVLKRLRDSESVVAAGEPLLEVGDSTKLEIVADFLSRDAVKIEAGQAVIIAQWGGDRPLAGRVRRVEPSGFIKISALGVEEQRVNVIIDPEQVPAALGDGFRVQVEVVLWQDDDVLKVPIGSLFRAGESWAVFELEEDVARLRPIELGRRSELEAQVLSGLNAGATVLVHPGDTIEDGVKVEQR